MDFRKQTFQAKEPFSPIFRSRLAQAMAHSRIVCCRQTIVCSHQTIICCHQTIVWRQQTISCSGVRPSCVYFRKKKSGAKVVESATAARKTSADASLFSSCGRLKRCKTGCTSAQNRNRAVRVVFLPIFLPRFHFQKVFYLLFLQQQFATLPPSGLRRLFSITF